MGGKGQKLSATNPTDEEKKCRLWHTAYGAVMSNWNRKGREESVESCTGGLLKL